MDKTAVKIITYFNGVEEFLIGILFFTIPFGWTFSIVPLILFSTTLLVNMFTKPKKPNKEKLLYFAPLIAMFVWGIITLIYSNNVKEGVETLTTQLALIVAALAFLFNKITASSVKKGFFMFILGCLGSVTIMYGMAIYKSSSIIGNSFVFCPFFNDARGGILDTDITGNYFTGTAFSSIVHPAYNALMLGMAMFIILHYLKESSKILQNHVFWLISFAVFGISIIAFSLIGTLALSVTIILLVLGILSVKKMHYGERSRAIYSILFLFAACILISPQANVLGEHETSKSLTQRMEVTNSTLEVIGDNWLAGVGIGDTDTELFKAYSRRGNRELAEKKLNSHNQFLTSWLQGGIVGLLLLIWSFVSLCLRAYRKKAILLYMFSVLAIVSFLFESMLLRYWGVITFAVFYGMLYFYSKDEAEDNILALEIKQGVLK